MPSGSIPPPLVQSREAYKRKQEQKRREQEEKEVEERRAQEEQHQRLLDEQKQKLLDGERITGGMFLEIAKRDSFEIHIRTQGVLDSRMKQSDKSGSITYSRQRGRAVALTFLVVTRLFLAI